MTTLAAPNRLVIEKLLPNLQKTFKAEFEGNKFILASVDDQELSPKRMKPRLGNVYVPEPAVEVEGESPYSIKVLDIQGTWWFDYPRAR